METALNKIRVLWVDDSRDLLELYEALFMDQEGYEGVGFLSSQDGLEQEIADRSPDVVVLDLSMPGRPPLNVMKECLATFPAVRFLVHSANDDASVIERAMRAGAAGYKVKDGDIEDLIRSLRLVARGK